MNSITSHRIIALVILLVCGLAEIARAAAPPVTRSTSFNGAHSNVIHYAVQSWMNTNTPNLTVETWVHANDLVGHQALVARSFTTNLYFGLNGNRLRFYRSGGTTVDSTGTIVAGRWTHVAVSYDGTTARFYIDGVAAGTAALANRGNNSTNGLSIGGQREQNAGGLYAFNGLLDEIRLWGSARSQAQIAANMNAEIRDGAGLLAAFGFGGAREDIRGTIGSTAGIPPQDRASGYGILPSNLCVPFSSGALRVDANIDLINEYRGAETIVLRSPTSATARDQIGYLMVSTNTTNFHLYVGIPRLPQGGISPAPTVQVAADVNVNDGPSIALGDWECRLDQETFQGGRIFGVNPPFFPTPQWLSWGQSTSAWQAATAIDFEFEQNYEFRIHGRHLNYFTNVAGLLVRYFDYPALGNQSVAPRGGITNLPATFARVEWCGQADTALRPVSVAGTVVNVSAGAGVPGRPVSLYSGNSELGGFLLASTTTDGDGRFSFSNIPAPIDRRVTVTYSPPGGSLIHLDPVTESNFPGRPDAVAVNSPFSVAYPPCPSGCTYESVHFRYRVLGPLSISGAAPLNVALPVMVRTSPVKFTPSEVVTVTGANFHNGVRVYFQGSGCVIDPPSLCGSDFVESTAVIVAEDGLSLTTTVPSGLTSVSGNGRNFRIVIENPSFPSTGGNRWNYGPNLTVTPPLFPHLYGFEFSNDDDGPSWQEFEACFGDNIFVDLPFSDVAVPGLRDPYYFAFYLPVYLTWMEIAQGTCSGFAATSRLMANGTIPSAAYDRADNGEGVHGVLYPNGYTSVPRSFYYDPNTNLVCEPCGRMPAVWSGFDLFRPFEPLNVWARLTSLQGSQTSAEFLNTWLGQLNPPIAVGPQRGISVGNPVQVLNRIRTDARENLIVFGGRHFESLHTVTPYGVIEEQGLQDDLFTPVARAGFSLIKIYDSNWDNTERLIEVNRTQNTFRYLMGFREDGTTNIIDGAGMYHMPMSVFRNGRHALGPVDVAVNLERLIRMLTMGTVTTAMRSAAGRVAGWTGTNIVNAFEGAFAFVLPGALPNREQRLDSTMFFLPCTNPPVAVEFVSGGSNVVLHYALGGGDFAFGFIASNTTETNSVYGIMMPPGNVAPDLNGIGVRVGATVQGFSASISSRDLSRRSLIWQLDGGAGTVMPDVHFERDAFASLKIRNNSAQPLTFRINLSGTEPTGGPGVFEFSVDSITQPGNSTLVLKPLLGTQRGILRELDANNDGTPETKEVLPARGALRASKESGLLALRWRPLTTGDTLLCNTNLNSPAWSPVGTTVNTEGADRVARLPLTGAHQFYRVTPVTSNCFSLAAQAPGAKPNPWTIGGFKFEAFNAAGSMLPQNTILTRSGATGLDVVHTMRIHPQVDCDTLHIDLRQTSGYVVLEAVGPLGAVVARQELVGPGAGIQRVTLRAFRSLIHHVRVISPNALCLIANICCERTPPQNTPPGYAECQSVSNANPGQFASPYPLGPVQISASPGAVVIGPVSGLGGNWLKLAGTVELALNPPAAPADRVRLRIRDFEGGVTAKAFNLANELVAEVGPLVGSATPQEVVLHGPGIGRVILQSTSDKAFLQQVCVERGTGH